MTHALLQAPVEPLPGRQSGFDRNVVVERDDSRRFAKRRSLRDDGTDMTRLRYLIFGILLAVSASACGAPVDTASTQGIDSQAPQSVTTTDSTLAEPARAASEWVHVKYREDGAVDVAEFEHFEPLDPPVTEAWYDRSKLYMIVNLEGTNYHYCRFSADDWAGFVDSGDAGSYYASHIRGSNDCRRGGVPSY